MAGQIKAKQLTFKLITANSIAQAPPHIGFVQIADSNVICHLNQDCITIIFKKIQTESFKNTFRKKEQKKRMAGSKHRNRKKYCHQADKNLGQAYCHEFKITK